VTIARGVRIGDRTVVYPNVTIGEGTLIGEDCVVHSQTAIRERVVIGNRVILQNGVVIGGDGYGFARRADGTHQKIPQSSAVVIEDDVEIGANTTVDRPAIGETRIQAGAKIDNLVQVGHGVNVGRNVLLAAQVGIAGSTTIGEGACSAGRWAWRSRVDRQEGHGRGPERHHELDSRRCVRQRLSGHRQPRMAQIVGDFPQAAGVAKEDRRARTTRARARGHAGRKQAKIEVVMAVLRHALKTRLPVAALVAALALVPLNAAVRPPRMQYSITTLPNGLTVVLSEDHSTPIVHADLWYHVGSKDERPGRTGFAHLFEHMMFKGSKNVAPEEHASMIASVGGQSNAYTNDDTTVFWETVPSQYLPLAMWLEADRMATLKIDEATFKAEREVVKEERRLRIDNQPFGRLTEFSTPTPSRCTPTSTRPSAAWRIWTPPQWTTCAISTTRITFPATPRWRWWGISIPRRRWIWSRNISAGSEVRPDDRPGLSEGAAGHQREARHGDGELAAAGRGGGLPHHLRRPSRFVSPASHVEDSVRRRELAHLQVAGVRAGHRGLGIRRRQHHRRAEPVLCRRHRPARAHAGGSGARVDCGVRQAARTPVSERELQRAKNQFFRDYITDRESTQGKAGQLATPW